MAFFYPKNKILENQYTAGKYLSYPNGVEYIGYYYILSDGRIFSGKNPQDSFTRELVSYTETLNRQINSPSITLYNSLKKDSQISQIRKFKDIPSYYPVLTEKEYKSGSITRYFCKKLNSNSQTIKEINQETYTSLFYKNNDYDYILNIVTKLPWQISGPLHDVYQDNILITPGIIDTNERQITIAEKSFPGLSNYLYNPLEFARILQ